MSKVEKKEIAAGVASVITNLSGKKSLAMTLFGDDGNKIEIYINMDVVRENAKGQQFHSATAYVSPMSDFDKEMRTNRQRKFDEFVASRSNKKETESTKMRNAVTSEKKTAQPVTSRPAGDGLVDLEDIEL